jgi:IS1 family transposase
VASDLSWWENTNYITKRAYQRMEIIRRLCQFSVPVDDLTHLYTLYVRSVLEFNCCVWNSNLTQAQENDIERVQKVACHIILQDSYSSYEDALSDLNLMSLKERRQQLCLKFANRCQKFEKSKDMFPLNDPNSHFTRSHEKFKVNFAETDRLRDSAIPQMQRLMNA